MKNYSKTFDIRWADLDPYQHVRHTAYYDYCTHARFAWFAENGFSQKEVERIGVGPVLLREEGFFLREISEGDSMRVQVLLLGLSEDGRRFRIRHDIYRGDGTKSAIVEIDGGWLDISRRRFGTPPDDMVNVWRRLAKTEDFTVLPDVRSRN